MSYHIVNVDTPNVSLSCSRGQLTCRTDKGKKQLPLEDIASIVINSFNATIHGKLLIEAAKAGVPLILCESFKPISLMLPANRSSDTLLTKAALSLERKKVDILWRKTITAKCLNQLALAKSICSRHLNLERLEKTARGKSQHKESTCSRFYWGIFAQAVHDSNFHRDTDGGGINDLLNYGYAILLSTVLQKLFAYGLDPTLGIGHSVRERSAPLAYDLMEPFRPCVDWRVFQWITERSMFQDYTINSEFRRWITGFIIEKVGYLEIEIEIRHCIESVIRSFRKSVLMKSTKHYKPWMPKNLKWVG